AQHAPERREWPAATGAGAVIVEGRAAARVIEAFHARAVWSRRATGGDRLGRRAGRPREKRSPRRARSRARALPRAAPGGHRAARATARARLPARPRERSSTG